MLKNSGVVMLAIADENKLCSRKGRHQTHGSQ